MKYPQQNIILKGTIVVKNGIDTDFSSLSFDNVPYIHEHEPDLLSLETRNPIREITLYSIRQPRFIYESYKPSWIRVCAYDTRDVLLEKQVSPGVLEFDLPYSVSKKIVISMRSSEELSRVVFILAIN